MLSLVKQAAHRAACPQLPKTEVAGLYAAGQMCFPGFLASNIQRKGRSPRASTSGPTNETRAESLDTPRDALEFQLVKIWEDVLRVRPIGIKEDFFELGGNSLLAIRMLARLEKL